jgi:hypothetical protein
VKLAELFGTHYFGWNPLYSGVYLQGAGSQANGQWYSLMRCDGLVVITD